MTINVFQKFSSLSLNETQKGTMEVWEVTNLKCAQKKDLYYISLDTTMEIPTVNSAINFYTILEGVFVYVKSHI